MEIKCGHCKLFNSKKCPLLGTVHRESEPCNPYKLYGCERDKVNKLLCEVERLKDAISGSFILNRESSEKLLAMMDNPPEPTDALKKLFGVSSEIK